MDTFAGMLIGGIIGGIIGFVCGIVLISGINDNGNSVIALKLSNIMNSSLLDCVTKQVITKEQVHDIEDIFFKHIEANFKHIKANHGDSYRDNK